jgi:hypothetical protein
MLRAAAPYFRREWPAIRARQNTFQAFDDIGGLAECLDCVHGAIQYRLIVLVVARFAEAAAFVSGRSPEQATSIFMFFVPSDVSQRDIRALRLRVRLRGRTARSRCGVATVVGTSRRRS